MPNRSGCGKGRETGNLAVKGRKYCQGQRYTVNGHYQSNFAALVTFSLSERELGAIKPKMDGKPPAETSVPHSGLAAETGSVTFLDTSQQPHGYTVDAALMLSGRFTEEMSHGTRANRCEVPIVRHGG